MRNVTCRCCGETRPIAIAENDCEDCGCNEITFTPGAVSDILNSRDKAELRCTSCDNELWNLDIDAYQHENGWVVPGLPGKWWLSIACPECTHETSFSHFGISR